MGSRGVDDVVDVDADAETIGNDQVAMYPDYYEI
jgi:hypothetical protein